MNRRELLTTTGAATLAALCMPKVIQAEAPASQVRSCVAAITRSMGSNSRARSIRSAALRNWCAARPLRSSSISPGNPKNLSALPNKRTGP
jgi:hypothetical protein